MRIKPGVVSRLHFFCVNADGTVKSDLLYTGVTSAKYRTITNGIPSADSTALTLAAASYNDAHATGSFGIVNSALGEYFVDCPIGAADASADYAELRIVLTDGTLIVYPILYAIDEKISLIETKAQADTRQTALLSAIATNVGTGDYRLTIPVQDADENAIAGARVSVPGTTLVATTGTAGTVFFNVDADTYTVRVTPPSGYETPDDTDVEVMDDDLTAEPIVLTPWFATPPDDPTLSTLLVKCVDEFGAIEPGVSVDVRLVKIPTGSTNIAFDGKKQSADSNESGLAQFNVVRLATYEYKRGSADVWTRAVIQDASSTSVTSFIGSD